MGGIIVLLEKLRGVRLHIALALCVAGVAFAAATVSSGFDPDATLKASVRYRNMGNKGKDGDATRIIIGDGDRSPATPCAGVAWLQSNQDNAISFTYNVAAATISTTVNGSTCSFSSGNLGNLNYVALTVKATGSPGDRVHLETIQVNGENVGSFTAPVLQEWNVKGIDLTAGFTIAGSIKLEGSHGGGDSSYVQIDVGYVEPPPPPGPVDTLGPVTSNVQVNPQPVLLNGSATVTATVSDATTGGSTISAAEYRLDNGVWTPASAVDFAFDEVTEDVTATIPTVAPVGVHTVCVRGTDSIPNSGEEECQIFVVDYDFHGFLSPIDMGHGVVNKAKAGQSVPAKWRLTDANGLPIADATSFVGLYSYVVSCSEFVGDPETAIQEVAAGNSSLQYLGDGYWQFNWKTPKEYENTCRRMYVEFNSTTTSPHVAFTFQKK